MFANTFQSGFISVFYSVGSNPLQLWDKQVKNGHIRRVVDDEVRSLVLEVSGTNVATTYITCPIKPKVSLGIKLPFLVMIIKNLKKYFTFEIQVLDDKDMHRRFRVSNFQSTTKVRPFCTTMPIGLSSGWNQVQFNLADFTKRAYGSTYLETTRIQIHANVRIRRIYFADMLYSDEDMPNEYKLFLPTPGSQAKGKQAAKKGAQAEAKAEEKAVRPSAEEVTQLQLEQGGETVPSGAPPTPAGVPPATPIGPEPGPSEPVETPVEMLDLSPEEKPQEESEQASPTATAESEGEPPLTAEGDAPPAEGGPPSGEAVAEAGEAGAATEAAPPGAEATESVTMTEEGAPTAEVPAESSTVDAAGPPSEAPAAEAAEGAPVEEAAAPPAPAEEAPAATEEAPAAEAAAE